MRRIRKKAKAGILLGAAFSFAAAGVMPAAAASISDIRLRLKAEEFDAQGMPVLEAVSANDLYTVLETERVGDEAEAKGPASEGKQNERQAEQKATASEVYQYEAELISETEDGFAVLSQEQIHLVGEQAVCIKAVRSDQGKTLRLTFELTEPGEIIGEVENLVFENGRISWNPAPGASAYYVNLYRNGKRMRDGHRTEGCWFDFSALMQEEGTYVCRIFPLTEKGKKGKRAESSQVRLDAFEAEQLQKNWNQKNKQLFGTEEKNTGWFLSAGDWYYRNRDGTLPSWTHLELDGTVYYFDGEGKWAEGS